MKGFRKCALALSLVAAISLSAATNRPLIGDGWQERISPSDDVITLIVDFFVLHSRLSLPPG